MQKFILGLALVALSGMSFNAFSDSDEDNGSKTSVCHKGRTVTINTSGLTGHLGHGDSKGSCEDRSAVVVMMQCKANEGDIVVVAVSGSENVAADDLPSSDGTTTCANALANLLDMRLVLSSVTSGSEGITHYLLTGYVGSP